MARVKSLAGYPIEQHNSPNRGGAMSGHRGVVLHIAQGTYRGTIGWQMNPDQRYADGTRVNTCSTWIVGREAGEWAQMVDTAEIAWAQRDGSRTWLSIELAGFAPTAPSAWQVEACAQLLAWAHRTHGIPIQSTGQTSGSGLGHHSMDNDTTVQWGHDACPGAGVIAAKDAIVARANQINGGDDDMMDLTDPLPSPKEVLATGEVIPAGNYTVGERLAWAHHSAWAAHWTARGALAAAKAADAKVTQLLERPAVQPAPVDSAALKAAVEAALASPAVLAAIAKAVADENHRRQAA